MAIRACKACEIETLEGGNNPDCLHQREVLVNPSYLFREFLRRNDKANIEYFENLKNFHLPNIL